MKNIINNDIILDENQVWILSDQEKFNYSDGKSSEKYLNKVFLKTDDLSSTSYELEEWIKDWPSEYHLSRKRSQLLNGFDFNRSSKVLEVGCGCGAITRFLGETFDEVIAIEGSIERAKLARLRTKGMDNVSILSSPFQKIKFKQSFDIIFCIGVFEYSNVFVDAKDPYDYILQYFDQYLSNNGIIVIAIENQFGLKYFSSSTEDHTAVMFDGIEGYPRFGNKAKTFGYHELKRRILKYFDEIDFYFPYPDYKIPSCILKESFYDKVNLSELLGNYSSRDYLSTKKVLFDEKFVLFELEKNNQLPFFSNSFLVIAGNNSKNFPGFNQLGLIFSDNRRKEFQCITKFKVNNDNGIVVSKQPVFDNSNNISEYIKLNYVNTKWIYNNSLSTILLVNVKSNDFIIDKIFSPCKIWLNVLKEKSTKKGDKYYLSGKYIDCIWRNSYINNNDCEFIDQEWTWYESIELNIIIIRSIFHFLGEVDNIKNTNSFFKKRSTKSIVKDISNAIGVIITNDDINEFCNLEAHVKSIVVGGRKNIINFQIKLIMWNKPIYLFIKLSWETISNMSKKLYTLFDIRGIYYKIVTRK